MLNKYRPLGELRDWHSVTMNIRLDAEINYLLEKIVWNNGGAKQRVVTQIIEKVLRDEELLSLIYKS